MSKRIYVAGSSHQLGRCEQFMRRCEMMGWEVTLNWTTPIREMGNANDGTFEQKAEWAWRDLEAVRRADLVTLLVPTDGSNGTGGFIEYGYALGAFKVTLVVHSKNRPSIFFSLATYHADHDEEGLDILSRATVPL